MTQPSPLPHDPHHTSGTPQPQHSWYPSQSSTGSPTAGPGTPYTASPNYSSPHTGPVPGAYPQSPQHPSAYQAPPAGYAPQQGKSSGGALKWLTIGCLGCGGIIAFVFIAMLVLATLSGGSSSPDDSPSDGVEQSDGGGDTAQPKDAKRDASAGDDADAKDGSDQGSSSLSGKASTDDQTIVVTSTERTQELQDSVFRYETDNEFVVMHIEYTNTSGTQTTLFASSFVLVGADGKTYGTNIDVSLAVKDPILSEDVNPGITYTGTLVFEAPPGTEYTELQLTDTWDDDVIISVPLD